MIPRFVTNHPRSFGAGAGALAGAGAGAAAGDKENRGRNALLGAAVGAGLGAGAGHLLPAKSVAGKAQQAVAGKAQQAAPHVSGLPARGGASAGLEEMAEHAKIREQAHKVLGSHSTKADYKKAFRNLAKEHHPDRNPGDESKAAKFREANEAYSAWQNHPDFQKLSSYFGPFFRELASLNAR